MVKINHLKHDTRVQLTDDNHHNDRLFINTTNNKSILSQHVASNRSFYQTTYNKILKIEEHPLNPKEILFMDLRNSNLTKPKKSPSFLYTIPLSPNRIFVEETILISNNETNLSLLETKLAQRLKNWKIYPKKHLKIEHCHIPMTQSLPSRNQQNLTFGTAASIVHPTNGYQLTHSFQKTPKITEAISEQLTAPRSPKQNTKKI